MKNTITTINPFTQQPIKTYPVNSSQEINQTLSHSEHEFKRWKLANTSIRKKIIEAIKQKLISNRIAYATLISTEMGKPLQQALAEVDKCALLCDYYISMVDSFLQPRVDDYVDKKVIHALAPTGIVLGIMPWNYPFWQVFRYAIPTLLAGNVVVLKHAPNVTGCSVALQEVFSTPEFPHLFQSLIIDVDQVESIIAHPAVQGVCLTGSVNAGKAVGSLAGKYLKKLVLELGSADAFVMLEDAKFETALDAAFSSRMLNAGQACIAAKRIFVPEKKLNDAVDYLTKKISNIKLGDPLKEDTYMGPISKLEFVSLLDRQVKQAIEYGAKKITGAEADGAFFTPGIIISEASNPMNKEEIFGPVINLIPYATENSLLDAINDTPFGLAASVWTQDDEHAQRWAEQIEAGSIAINDFMKSDPRIPFGGIKNSGFGRELGELGFRSFMNEKAIIRMN
jgi:succinate-semialdehyde dehydrogenase / glutarate-semialdehyde dehydrogenase